MPSEGWLSLDSAEPILDRQQSGNPLPPDQYYLRPEEILSDAGMVPLDRQTQQFREHRLQTLRLCSGQSRPSSRGRRGPAKSGGCVRSVGGGI
jgi:hypothetical protein